MCLFGLFNTPWGFCAHKKDKALTRKLVCSGVFVLSVILEQRRHQRLISTAWHGPTCLSSLFGIRYFMFLMYLLYTLTFGGCELPMTHSIQLLLTPFIWNQKTVYRLWHGSVGSTIRPSIHPSIHPWKKSPQLGRGLLPNWGDWITSKERQPGGILTRWTTSAVEEQRLYSDMWRKKCAHGSCGFFK